MLIVKSILNMDIKVEELKLLVAFSTKERQKVNKDFMSGNEQKSEQPLISILIRRRDHRCSDLFY